MPNEFISPFKDYVCPQPEVKGDWGGRIGGNITDAPATTPDELKGGDTVMIQDSPAPGATVTEKRLPGS
jgi:hypothetical protein